MRRETEMRGIKQESKLKNGHQIHSRGELLSSLEREAETDDAAEI